MLEDENVIDDFINALRTNPELLERFKEGTCQEAEFGCPSV